MSAAIIAAFECVREASCELQAALRRKGEAGVWAIGAAGRRWLAGQGRS